VVSSVGSERLPYKQEVTGSNPVLPTVCIVLSGLVLIDFKESRVSRCYIGKVTPPEADSTTHSLIESFSPLLQGNRKYITEVRFNLN
jgi:hypothetical protein